MKTIWRFSRRSFLRFAAASAGGVALAAVGIRVLWRRCPVCGVRAGTHLVRRGPLSANYCGSCGVNVERQRWDLEDVERTKALCPPVVPFPNPKLVSRTDRPAVSMRDVEL
jgi:hypothetical protein